MVAAVMLGVAGLLRAAEVFIAPAVLESFGIEALEARCSGVPVLARGSTGVAEFVRHGHEGSAVHFGHRDGWPADPAGRRRPLRESIDRHNRHNRHNRKTPGPIGWPSVLAGASPPTRRRPGCRVLAGPWSGPAGDSLAR